MSMMMNSTRSLSSFVSVLKTALFLAFFPTMGLFSNSVVVRVNCPECAAGDHGSSGSHEFKLGFRDGMRAVRKWSTGKIHEALPTEIEPLKNLLANRREGRNTYSPTTCSEAYDNGFKQCRAGCKGVLKVKVAFAGKEQEEEDKPKEEEEPNTTVLGAKNEEEDEEEEEIFETPEAVQDEDEAEEEEADTEEFLSPRREEEKELDESTTALTNSMEKLSVVGTEHE